jgi:hypothetical protein
MIPTIPSYMKPPIPLLLAVASMSLSVFAPLAARADDLIDLTFESTEPNNPPVTEPFQTTQVNHTLESISVTANNRLEVVKNAPNFLGKSLRFIKGSPEPRTPTAGLVSKPGLITSGKVRFSWSAAIDSFTPGEKFPGFEALLTFVLLDRVGKPFFNLYFLVGKDLNSGILVSGTQKFGPWQMGEKQDFEVTIDFDKKTASVSINGTQVSDDMALPDADGLRVVQFTDGTGLAFYGSQFTATMGGFKMIQL